MSKLTKVYSVSFMKHTNALGDTIYNEETDEYLSIGHETFLVKEDDLSKYKSYGGGYKSINFIGNMYIDEENKMSEIDTTTTVATGQFRYIPEEGCAVPTNITTNITSVFKNCPVYESEIDAMQNLEPYHENGIAPDKRYLVPEVPTLHVRYHKELCPELIPMEKNEKGDFIDLRAAEDCTMKKGDFKLISLGISIDLPKGYHAEVVPRSSTYKNFGIIMSNSIGIIDESYCGDNDIWRFPAIAMRDTEIHINDRICQFRIVKNRDLKISVVDKLDNEDRGGFGSTGKN